MWNHLCEIVAQKNKTVLITTHYVEETRNSNKVRSKILNDYLNILAEVLIIIYFTYVRRRLDCFVTEGFCLKIIHTFL